MSIEFTAKKNLRGFRLELDFENHHGKLGILGASGCGKSMTLKCIAGIVRPDQGRIVLNGRTLFDSEKKIDLKPQQRKVGYLFQSYALFPHLTVVDNIACGLSLTKQEARRHPRIRQLLDLLHLQGLEERYPGQLSGGQQQRVALARILAYQPEIILLDEPFAALDEYLKEQLHLQLSEVLRNWGDDVMLVTHNRDEVYKICDTLLILDHGQKIDQGDMKALFASPGHRKTARLTGCKNISRASKHSEYQVDALDWGVRLTAAEPVTPEISAVGIRAHDFYPAQADAANSIAITPTETHDGPFERNIIFKAAGPETLWWKFPRPQEDAPLPAYLAVKPEKVLLLQG